MVQETVFKGSAFDVLDTVLANTSGRKWRQKSKPRRSRSGRPEREAADQKVEEEAELFVAGDICQLRGLEDWELNGEVVELEHLDVASQSWSVRFVKTRDLKVVPSKNLRRAAKKIVDEIRGRSRSVVRDATLAAPTSGPSEVSKNTRHRERRGGSRAPETWRPDLIHEQETSDAMTSDSAPCTAARSSPAALQQEAVGSAAPARLQETGPAFVAGVAAPDPELMALGVAELRRRLARCGVRVPVGVVEKAELAALLRQSEGHAEVATWPPALSLPTVSAVAKMDVATLKHTLQQMQVSSEGILTKDELFTTVLGHLEELRTKRRRAPDMVVTPSCSSTSVPSDSRSSVPQKESEFADEPVIPGVKRRSIEEIHARAQRDHHVYLTKPYRRLRKIVQVEEELPPLEPEGYVPDLLELTAATALPSHAEASQRQTPKEVLEEPPEEAPMQKVVKKDEQEEELSEEQLQWAEDHLRRWQQRREEEKGKAAEKEAERAAFLQAALERRQAEAEAERKRCEEEAKRKAAELEEKKRLQEEAAERRRKEKEEKRRAEEEARQAVLEERRRREEEMDRMRVEEERERQRLASIRRQLEREAEEERRKKEAEEEAARGEGAAARAEEERRRLEEQRKKRKAEEERRKKQEEEEFQRRLAAEQEEAKAREEERQRQLREEAEKKRKEEEAESFFILESLSKKEEAATDIPGTPLSHVQVVLLGSEGAGKTLLFAALMKTFGGWNDRELAKFQKEHERGELPGEEVRRGDGLKVPSGASLTLIDVPGSRRCLPQAVQAVAESDIALIVVSAKGQEFEASLRDAAAGRGALHEHLRVAGGLGIRRVVVAVAKMGEAKWAAAKFEAAVSTLRPLLVKAGFSEDSVKFAPVDGLKGDLETKEAPWHKAGSLPHLLDNTAAFLREREGPFRAVVLEPGKAVAGGVTATARVEQGTAQKGQKCLLAPGQTSCMLDALHVPESGINPGKSLSDARCGEVVQLTLHHQGGASDGAALAPVGACVCDAEHQVKAVSKLKASLDLLEMPRPLTAGFRAVLHVHACTMEVEVAKILSAEDLETGAVIDKPKVVRAGQRLTVMLELAREAPTEPVETGLLPSDPRCSRLGLLLLRSEETTMAVGRVLELPKDK